MQELTAIVLIDKANKSSKATHAQGLCGLTHCYVDAPTGARESYVYSGAGKIPAQKPEDDFHIFIHEAPQIFSNGQKFLFVIK